MVMHALGKKMWRTMWHGKAQFMAMVALVMLGIAVYVSMSTAFYNLNRSKDAFYQKTRFADYYFQVVRAPETLTRQIGQLAGITSVTGRIEEDIPVIKQNGRRATARIIGYPMPVGNDLNLFQIKSGRLFDQNPTGGGIEVLVDPQYAKANKIGLNDTIQVVAGSRLVTMTVVGTAISPEFIYNIQNAASLAPDPRTFCVVMMPLYQAQQILNMPGQINQVVVKLSPDADEQKTVKQVENLLQPYGNLASYARKDQLSNVILNGELNGLLAMSRSLPLMFFGIAITLQFILLSRMVKNQRLTIGILKALGFNNRQIAWHYAGYAVTVSLTGAVLGSLLGLFLAVLISRMYTQFFNLPGAIGGFNSTTLVYGFLLSTGVGLLAGLYPARGVTAIHPAEAMRPRPPKSSGRILLERWNWLWRRITPAWKMSLRTAGRNKTRFLVTLSGVALAVALLVGTLFGNNSMDFMIQQHFNREAHYDLKADFTTPVKESEILNISSLDGILKAEPYMEIPVRVSYGGRSADLSLTGLPPAVTMQQLVSSTGGPLQLPEDGILLDQRTAAKLGVHAGDRVAVKTILNIGPPHYALVRVSGITREFIGNEGYTSLAQANRILGESSLVSGVMLKVDPGKDAVIEQDLGKMTNVSTITNRQREISSFRALMAYFIYFDVIMFIFAMVLGFAIVFNASVMGFSERERELASMRVIGFSRKELRQLLWKENILQSLLGIIIGLPLGYLIVFGYVKMISTGIYTLPLIVYPSSYVFSSLGGLLFVIMAQVFVTRRLQQLNPVDILKDRD